LPQNRRAFPESASHWAVGARDQRQLEVFRSHENQPELAQAELDCRDAVADFVPQIGNVLGFRLSLHRCRPKAIQLLVDRLESLLLLLQPGLRSLADRIEIAQRPAARLHRNILVANGQLDIVDPIQPDRGVGIAQFELGLRGKAFGQPPTARTMKDSSKRQRTDGQECITGDSIRNRGPHHYQRFISGADSQAVSKVCQ
jgi:hypothetical protein